MEHVKSDKDFPHNCEICGKVVEQKPGKGRPRAFHVECGKLFNLLQWTETQIETVLPTLKGMRATS